MNNTTIPRPQRSDKGRIVGEFYPLQRAELLALRDSDLARGPFYVHLCMRFENPWCDRPFAISVGQFCKRWHIPESNFYRAISKLQEMQILDWEPREIFFYWKSPTSENQFPVVGDSPSSGSNSPSSGSEIPSSESNSPSSGNLRSPEPLIDKAFSDDEIQTIQINSEPIHTYLDENDESEKQLLIQEPKSQSPTTLLNQSESSQQNKLTRIDPFFARRPKPQEIEWDWVPDGEWKIDGKLDANFVDWHARRWMQKYGAIDIHEARKNVRAYYRNDPRRLADDWQEYHEATLHKAANIATRQSNGINVPEAEKAAIAKHQAALQPTDKSVVKPQYEEVKQYVSVNSEQLKSENKPILCAEKEIDWDALADESRQWEAEQTRIPEGAENPQAYINTVRPEDSDYWRRFSEQRQSSSIIPIDIPTSEAEARKLVADAIANIKPMPKFSRAERYAQTRLQHWNNLLQTGIPSVIADVERQVAAAGLIIVDGCVVSAEDIGNE
ncbi:hypothetical protein I8748_32230 [Nostoc sp. CENA67]|uniref:Uncharacterized protein n=1 Tax=Amazonocrinis nigriterrae CENA67 TaxID=2794033 RepID=A0A8J7LBI9_9NOST|nr:hypothetical protein [Amazonocrinis nigriterrae]MBH8566768.1 hypothetical protein [Amazonocrinis nigriterrae CENA67]